MPIIKVEGLSKKFGDLTAVNNVSFDSSFRYEINGFRLVYCVPSDSETGTDVFNPEEGRWR